MKRTIVSQVVFASVFVVGSVSNAQARQCSNASLQGSYGFRAIATIAPAGTPRAVIGLFTFDGKGNFSATLTVNDNGAIRQMVDTTATYTVNPDCTGTLLPSPSQGGGAVAIVVVDSGREFYQMRTDPSNIVLFGVTKKVFRHDE